MLWSCSGKSSAGTGGAISGGAAGSLATGGAGGAYDGGQPRDTATDTATIDSLGAGGFAGRDSSMGSCDPKAWVYMGDDPTACVDHLGESCGWTPTNLSQGYHCQAGVSGPVCSAGGDGCGGQVSTGAGGAAAGGGGSGGTAGRPAGGAAASGGTAASGGAVDASATGGQAGSTSRLFFGPYKDTSINLNWNTNVISTKVSGSTVALATDLVPNGAKLVTLAFATGECGGENWGGVAGADLASANRPLFDQSGVRYILSTGGAAGTFTCSSDAGMKAFLSRWSGPGLAGVDFDIEAGQTPAIITSLVARIGAAHGAYPALRFSLTLATLADNDGATTAQSLGPRAASSLNTYGTTALQAVKSQLGFDGTAATWPTYLTVNLMTMDYGAPAKGVCVVSAGLCQMGQSAIQAAYNLRDQWGVPLAYTELTPMIGGNDAQDEHFTLDDVATVAAFALSNNLAGVHYWSHDRDTDCATGAASPTCSSAGATYAGPYGFLKRFLASGLD